MSTISSKWLHAGEWLLNRRWWLSATASLSVVIFELLEYQPLLNGVNSFFFFEVIFYGVILPASTGLALSWLAASRSELAWSAYYQNLIPNLSLQMHNAHHYDELASVVVQFVRVVLPLVGITIFKSEQNGPNYKTVLNWSMKNDIPFSNSSYTCASELCAFMPVNLRNDTMALELCRDSNTAAFSRDSQHFCLPFLFSNSLVAGARLYLSSDSKLSPEQVRLLKEIAPQVASAFQRIELEQRIKQRDDTISSEQQRIARDVHDALGHNLAYLHLRLDQISTELNQTMKDTLQHDMETLRDVAKEAYGQMRGLLITLSPDHDSNLDNVLMSYADKISRRVNLQIKFRRAGQVRTLPPLTRRNIFYIFQETLTNIEKHANARNVDVELRWQETCLEVKVNDDGVGYDLAQPVPNGHFGLYNMRERAQVSNAELSISSEPGHGTQLVLRAPYEDEP